MARPSNREQRRADIVRGLMVVLPTYGYERATTARIAAAAGLTTGLIHHHFKNKQAILLALAHALVEAVDRRVTDAETARGRLHAYLDAHLALGPGADAGAVACWVAIGAEALFQPEVGEVYREVIKTRRAELMKRLIAVCQDERRTLQGLESIASALLALVEGFFQLASAAPDTVPHGTAASTARAVADQLLDGQRAAARS